MRSWFVIFSCFLTLAIAGCVSVSTQGPRYLSHCMICGSDAINDGSCTKCGVMAYEPRSYTAEEENTATDRALEKLATLPRGMEVFISSSPIHKPSWVTSGVNQIARAVGGPVRVTFSGNWPTEENARHGATVEQQTMWPASDRFEAGQWYYERSATLTEAGIVMNYRAWALWFGENRK